MAQTMILSVPETHEQTDFGGTYGATTHRPGSFRKKLWSGIGEILRLSSSLPPSSSSTAGTGVPIAERSSRSRLCRTWLRNTGSLFVHGNTSFPALFTALLLTFQVSYKFQTSGAPREADPIRERNLCTNGERQSESSSGLRNSPVRYSAVQHFHRLPFPKQRLNHEPQNTEHANAEVKAIPIKFQTRKRGRPRPRLC